MKFLRTKADLRGLLVLLAAVLIFAGVSIFLKKKNEAPDATKAVPDSAMLAFQDDVIQYDDARRSQWRNSSPNARGRRAVETFVFDPNTADSLTLLRLGLSPWQISNMQKYKAAGGRWRKPEQFRKLYGLSEEDYQRLLPYIKIAENAEERQWREEREARQAARATREATYDSVRRTYPQKFAEGTQIDANTCDTNALKRIPGVGSYYARRICAYRDQLGGFVDVSQVAEAHADLPKGIERWFCLNSAPSPRQINVNKATFKELVHHPYLSYEQVKEIFQYRQNYGSLKEWSDLRLSKQFSQKDFERLRPYFSF